MLAGALLSSPTGVGAPTIGP